MDLPIKAFEIEGEGGDFFKLHILKVYGYPDEKSFRGGYDVKCRLEISSGIYRVYTEDYFGATGAIQTFYNELKKCYESLCGIARYEVYCAENDLVFNVSFDGGDVVVSGSYKDDGMKNNVLNFEFTSNQSYFRQVLSDLKRTLGNF